MTVKNLLQTFKQRFDGFTDLMGFGTSRDIIQRIEWQNKPFLTKSSLHGMYAQHEMAAKVIDMLPDDALRGWIELQDDKSPEIEALLTQLYRLLCEPEDGNMSPLKAARLDGGAAIYLECDGDPSQPITGPTEICSFQFIEKEYLQAIDLGRSLRREMYRMYTDNGGYIVVHKSRLVTIQGVILPTDYMILNNGWGGSELERPSKPLIAYSLAHAAVPQILKDFIRDVVKIQDLKGLAINACSDDLQAFKDKMDSIKIGQTMYNATVLDSDDEWIRQTASIAGINDLIRNPEKALVACTPYPHTKLFNESPGAALSQAGSSQEKNYNQTVSGYQEIKIRPIINQVLKVATGKDFKYRFAPLDVPSQKEQADTLNTVADAISKLVSSKTATPQECATMLDGDELTMLPVLSGGAAQMAAESKQMQEQLIKGAVNNGNPNDQSQDDQSQDQA
jgi:phage-related protein (TIGR01555 family)